MFFPDITYGFTPKDLTSVFAELLLATDSETGTFGTIGLTLTGVPQDRMLMLSNVTVDALPGATQTIDRLLIEVETHTGLRFPVASQRFQLAAPVPAALNWQGQVFVLGQGAGNDTVFVTASFSSGTNANTAVAGFSGVVVPRGNMAVF